MVRVVIALGVVDRASPGCDDSRRRRFFISRSSRGRDARRGGTCERICTPQPYTKYSSIRVLWDCEVREENRRMSIRSSLNFPTSRASKSRGRTKRAISFSSEKSSKSTSGCSLHRRISCRSIVLVNSSFSTSSRCKNKNKGGSRAAFRFASDGGGLLLLVFGRIKI